jgi:aminoglycoside phosphotransferase
MKTIPKQEMDEALDWCVSVLGPVDVISDSSKEHGGHVSATHRLQTKDGFCYLKIHRTSPPWHNEVHAYEHWAGAFGRLAPRLLAVRDEPPLALLIDELPGQNVEDLPLTADRQRSIWQAAGAALVALHHLGPSDCFGPCWRDGTCAEEHPQDAQEYVSRRFSALIEKAIQGGYISPAELSTVRAAYALVPAFEGERPIPCHRDYCAANWLVSPEGALAGIIDFEFAYWDVRVADFARDPDWAWIRRPDLMEAFFDGYIGNGGRSFSRTTELQLLVARAEYALDAILWGHDFAFYGFEQEGREALSHLARP